MSATQRISVAMATYNGAPFLTEQLDSILRQRFSEEFELEIVVADDASTDKTLAILESYRSATERLIVLPSGQNRGFGQTFERALSRCTGEFLFLADQDDVWPIDRLQILISVLKSGADLAYGDFLLTDRRLLPVERRHSGEPSYDLRFKNRVPGMTMGFKRWLLKEILPIEGYFHDWWILLIALHMGRVEYVPEVVTYYRQHGSNTVGVRSRRQDYEDFVEGLRERGCFYEKLANRIETRSSADNPDLYQELEDFYKRLATGTVTGIMAPVNLPVLCLHSTPCRAWFASIRQMFSGR